jgi:hypothetical protein
LTPAAATARVPTQEPATPRDPHQAHGSPRTLDTPHSFRDADRRALRADPTAAPTARCRTASTRQAARRRSSEVRVAAHGGARGRAWLVWHRVAHRSRQVQPAHAWCAGPPWSAGACSRSERRCLGSRRQPLLDTRSVGREFRAGLASRGAVPDPQAEGDARRPAGGQGTNPAGRQARSGPLGALGNQGTVPPARSLGVATRTTSGQTGPTRRTEELPGCPHLVGRDLCFLDCREPAHGRDG